jgi:hypothetical protein
MRGIGTNLVLGFFLFSFPSKTTFSFPFETLGGVGDFETGEGFGLDLVGADLVEVAALISSLSRRSSAGWFERVFSESSVGRNPRIFYIS